MRFWILIIASFLPLSLVAQLSAPGSNSVKYTSYFSSPGVRDPIFIYCNSTGLVKGVLTANYPGGPGSYNFDWYQWSNLTNSFSIDVKSESNVPSSTISNLSEGGYRVIIDNSGTKTTLTGWIFFDLPPIAGAQLANPLKNCNYVALDGDTSSSVKIFNYKNPATGGAGKLFSKITFLWSSNPTSSIPYPDFEIDPVTYVPPLENVTYKLRVNSFGCSSEASFFYESIHVNADFTAVPTSGEAPLRVNFVDKSVRGYKYSWKFGDDSLKTYNKPEQTDSIIHTYYKPDEYSVLLTIESERHCVDSLRFNYVDVERSSMGIPNVFTPDGDGYNDYFTIDSKSLRFLSVEVFTRSGLKVYGFTGEGERLRDWTGWDGKINDSSIEARPGVYFYIIRALGWDNIKYDSKEYRGFLYLYR